ncbi:MAG: hypothetical protein K8U03_03335 [Planctomycetia bacterium]|nr:hypothetical protein [Planctomycetia bacterium]
MLSLVCSLLLTTLAAEPARPADVMVVCPGPFEEALRPWIEYRQKQGHVVAMVSGEEKPTEIKARLRAAYAAEPKLSILIIGDVENPSPFNPSARTFTVPTHFETATINVLFGSEPTIPTDNWYADFDDDGVPEAAIGRLPVDSAYELHHFIKRIIAYEQSTDFGPWRRKINFIAGLGGFGPVADAALEAAAKTLITNYLPPAYVSTMTYASWQSPYFPGGEEFHETVVERFNEGCLMWVYIGHGGRREFDYFRTPDGKVHRIFSTADVAKLQAQKHPPIALFLSCYSGAYDAPQDCLAEEMLRREGGPIAVMSGTRVTMPYAMSILGQELMTGFFQQRPATIGQLLRDAKRGLALKPRTSDADKQFDALATAMMPMAADLKAQRIENLHLFNLLGDPLLRLKHPETVSIQAPSEVRAGEQVKFGTTSPIAGETFVEFDIRRDRLRLPPLERDTYDGKPPLQYKRNDFQEAQGRNASEAPAGVPADWSLSTLLEDRGDYYVRVYVEGKDSFALGSSYVKVRPPVKPK